jgi:MarR family transcriptional regulator for hemolysin
MDSVRGRHPPGSGAERGRGGPGRETYFSLLRCSHIFASVVREILEIKLLRQVSPTPLTPSQLHLLKLMCANGPHQVGEVADFLGVSPPAASKNIDKLAGLELVRRSPSPGDRRATLLAVGPKGRKLVEDYENLVSERLVPALESFDHEEREQLAMLLARFSVALLEGEEIEDCFCLRCAAYVDSDCPVLRVRGGCFYQRARAAHSGSAGARETV